MKLPTITIEIQTGVAAFICACAILLGLRNQYGWGALWFIIAGMQLAGLMQGMGVIYAKSRKANAIPNAEPDEWAKLLERKQ